jgi:hypothetical protein
MRMKRRYNNEWLSAVVRRAALLPTALVFVLLFAAPALAANPGPPIITSTSFFAVSDTSATLHALVDPHGREVTDTHFQYIPQATYEADGNTFGAGTLNTEAHVLPAQVKGTGNLITGSSTIANLTVSQGAFVPGLTIEGAGIAPETTIVEVIGDPAAEPAKLKISKPAIATLPPATLLTATGPEPLAARIEGLSTGTAYRVRVFAENVKSPPGGSFGEELTFTTLLGSQAFGPCPNDAFRSGVYAPPGDPSASLPDCRAYEQASPVAKNGGDALSAPSLTRAAATGRGVGLSTDFGIPGGSGAPRLPSYLAVFGGSGWVTRGLFSSAAAGQASAILGWLPDFSASFAAAVRLTATGNEQALLELHPGSGAAATQITPYVPGGEGARGLFAYAGASADGSTVVFEAHAALPPREALPSLPGAVAGGASNVYTWDRASGLLTLVSRMNTETQSDAELPDGAFAGPYAWGGFDVGDATLGVGGAWARYYAQAPRAIAKDGSVFFTAAGTGQLYERLNPTAPQSNPGPGGEYVEEGHCAEPAKACTIRISATEKDNGTGEDGHDAAGEAPAAFMAASEDGKVAFFTSPEKLTDDANTGPEPVPPTIGRAGLDGSNPERSLAFPRSGKGYGNVDGDSEHIYWSDAETGEIGRAGLQGENPEPDFITGIDNPQGVAVDGSSIYWTSAVAGEGIASYRVVFQGKYAGQNVPRMTCTIVFEQNPGSDACEVSAERDGGGSVEEQQTLTLSGTDTGAGVTITLTCDGATTPVIFEAAKDSESARASMQNALESTCGAGNFTVLRGAGLGTVGRADLNGPGPATNVERSCIAGASDPRGIDVYAGFAYWLNEASSTLARADVSGDCASAASSADQTYLLLSGGGGRKGGGGFEELGDLAVNSESIYYSSHSVDTSNRDTGVIVHRNIDGTGSRLLRVIELPDAAHAPPLALDSEHLYWGDYTARKIGRQSIGGVEDPFSDAVDSHGDLFVANRSGPVDVYGPDGSLITATFAPYRTEDGQVFEIAVDSQGYLYAQAGQPVNGIYHLQILKFKPSNPGSAPTSSTTYSLDRSLGESAPGAEDGDGVLDSDVRSNAVAVDPSNDDVYTSHLSANEKQKLTVSGFSEGDTFELSNLPAACGSASTGPISYEGSLGQIAEQSAAALESACFGAPGGDFDGSASNSGGTPAITIYFQSSLANQNLPQLSCSAVSSASGSCSSSTETEGSPSHISQYHSDGSLVSNAIGTGVTNDQGVPNAQYVGLDVYGANHNVYAADDANRKAYVFSAGNPAGPPSVTIDGSGTSQGSFGFDVNIVDDLGGHIAVDQSNGHLYLLDGRNEFLDQFDASGAYLSQVVVGTNPSSVAIDRSGGPADGTAYVTDVNNRVDAYDSSYAPLPALSHTGYDPEPDLVTGVPTPVGLALDAGHVYWSSSAASGLNPGNDLYRWTAVPDSGGHHLTDLTVDAGLEDGAEALGVLGASPDGAYLYFVANGVLASNQGALGAQAQPGTCRGAFPHDRLNRVKGECNLYLYHEGQLSFIARLAPRDTREPNDALDWSPSPELFGSEETLRPTALGDGGRVLLFASTQKLTAYENHGVSELYRYRAGAPQLTCISCNSSVTAPSSAPRVLPTNLFGGVAPRSSETAATAVRFLSASGDRVFFETTEALVGADTNGEDGCPFFAAEKGDGARTCEDAYEWEAPGAGSCTEVSAAYSQQRAGCLYLLALPGGGPSFFADADEEGENVYVFTRDRLVGQDTDSLFDVYDVREGGGLASQNQPPGVPCEGEACKSGPPSPAAQAQTPATAHFQGPPNPKATKTCPKGEARRGARCVPRQRHKKHRHKAPHRNHHRKGNR